MTELKPNCPKCGAELVSSGDGFKHYACDTMTRFDGGGVEGEKCLRRQISALRAEAPASMSLENDIETHFTVFADYDKHPELRPERPSDPTKKRIMHIRVMRALSALREADEQVAALQARLARFEGPLTEAEAEGICESTCNMLDPEHVQSIDIASLAVRRGR